MKKRCIALYSGGLDSILAVKLLEEQGIDVVALSMASPFFNMDALVDPCRFKDYHEKKYGVLLHIVDFTDDIVNIISNPKHGFGKHLNPCIDCKAGMISRCASLMEVLDASFIVTGEVIGQRPMSQRRDAMNAIENETNTRGILLRPLSALCMKETLPETEGIVCREKLLNITGRGRKQQMELASRYNIGPSDIPTPAGGCLLADEQISLKVRHTFDRLAPEIPSRADLLLDVAGRKFILDDDAVVVVSRNDVENNIISTFKYPGNTFMKIYGIPGPLAVLRGEPTETNLRKAASICLRYSKARGRSGFNAGYGTDPFHLDEMIDAPVISNEECRSFQIDLSSISDYKG